MGLLTSAYITVTARGMGQKRTPLERGHRVLLFNTMGPQFEKYGALPYKLADGTQKVSELEVSDFIVKPGAQERTPFLRWSSGLEVENIPSHQDILKAPDTIAPLGKDSGKPYVRLNDGAIFLRATHQEASDAYLSWVMENIKLRTKGKPFYLKAAPFAAGYFAQAKEAGNLRPEIILAMVSSYLTLLKNDRIPKGSVIECMQYGALDALPEGLGQELRDVAKAKGVSIVWTPEGDIFDFDKQTDLEGKTIDLTTFERAGLLVVLNAGDAMSWIGNEKVSASLESMIANNSNMRLVMNWWANPLILKKYGQQPAS